MPISTIENCRKLCDNYVVNGEILVTETATQNRFRAFDKNKTIFFFNLKKKDGQLWTVLLRFQIIKNQSVSQQNFCPHFLYRVFSFFSWLISVLLPKQLSYRSYNYCNSNSCHSFFLLKGIAESINFSLSPLRFRKSDNHGKNNKKDAKS